MPRETARQKADRVLTEGRLIVHRVGYRAGRWWCTCPVRTDQCSHLHAVRRVLAVDVEEPT